MGCGASVPKPMPDDQRQELFQAAAKTLVLISTQNAFDTVVKDKSKVAAPEDGTKYLKNVVAKCREVAAGAGDVTQAKGDAVAAKAGGALGGMLGKAADLAGAVVGGGANAVLTPIADAIEKKIQELDDAFSEVASDLVAAKKAELGKVYEGLLNNCKFADVETRVRGSDNKACCAQFQQVCGPMLKEQLLPPSQDFIDKSKAVKAWDLCIEKVNEFNNKLETLAKKDVKCDPITLDINVYIVDEVIKQITAAMEKQEAEVRAAPVGKSTAFTAFCNAPTFEVCFSQEPLMDTHWKVFKPTP